MSKHFYLLSLMFEKRLLLLRSVFYDLKFQYAGSVLGIFWVFVGPLLLTAMYIGIYLFILKVKPDNISPEEYVLYVVAGLLPYFGIIQAIQKSSSSILQSKALLYNTLYPIEFIPIRDALSALTSIVVGLLIITVFKLALHGLSWQMLAIPLYLPALMFAAIGIGMITSLVMVAFQDLSNIMQYLFMALLFVTPIGYFIESLPPKLQILAYLNPFYHFISPFQQIIAFNSLPTASHSLFIYGMSLILFFVGGKFFRAFKMSIYEFI